MYLVIINQLLFLAILVWGEKQWDIICCQQWSYQKISKHLLPNLTTPLVKCLILCKQTQWKYWKILIKSRPVEIMSTYTMKLANIVY
jgi:hypothetical protein